MKKRILLIISLFSLMLFYVPVHAQDDDAPDRSLKDIYESLSFADEAIGVQTKGQLQNLIMNYGQITDTRYEDRGNAPTETFFNFRYPRENFTGLVDDFSLFFAIRENSKNGDQGNVVDGWTDNDNEDWIAKDGAYGKTHYNPANDPAPHEELLYSGQTPYLAHSDLEDTWPVDATGTSFWPGRFRRDAVTGVEVEGEFASDRDIYLEFTDGNNQLGNVIGLEVQMMAYSYGRVYAEDALFYEIWILNKSGKDLTDCWMGFYQDPDCSDYGEEILLHKDSSFSDGSKVFSLAQRDIDGDIGGATFPNALGITEDYTFGTVVFETPDNLGITDFHYFQDTGPREDKYLWAIITSDPANPNIVGTKDNYFHGDNTRIDDVSLITEPEDLVWIIASGPFDIAAGDTTKMTIAVVVGDDDADYYKNLWEAKKLYDAHFNGPAAPPSPELRAVAGDERITLYWDDAPESAVDPGSGEQDFQGYKIYRSEDNGTTWGTKITDALGRTYGYVPIAQFDKNDNIKGVDPNNPLNYLGSNTGLQHSWVDSNVVNGITYSYTIVSYDGGTSTLQSFEGAKGDGPEVDNFITLTPAPAASNKIPAEVSSFNQVSGTGSGEVEISIIDETSLSTDSYKLTFQGTPAQTFTLSRMDQSNTILHNNIPINATDVTIVDGFTLNVDTDDKVGGVKSVEDENGNSVEGSSNISRDSSWYVSVTMFPNSDTLARTIDYTIIFSDDNSYAYSWGVSNSTAAFEVPFSVYNQNSGEKLAFEVQDANGNSAWDEGETIFLTRAAYPAGTVSIGDPNPASEVNQFAYQVLINNAPSDAAGNPPVSGTTIYIESNNPYTYKDEIQFAFSPPVYSGAENDLSRIKVVPNPYIVVSRYESLQNVREIRFMFLPSECTIFVYSLSGTLVKTLHHNSSSGSLSWNLLTDWNQALAYGVYVYVVEDNAGNSHTGKFALIK